jgi:hypothetical protein
MTAHAITVLPVPGGATSTLQIASGQDLDGRVLRPGQLSRPGARGRDRASTGVHKRLTQIFRFGKCRWPRPLFEYQSIP